MTTNIITAIVSAYCSCTSICCPPSSKGLTANGTKPIQGITIAASRSIPLGSKVYVDGKLFTVQDRLSRRYDNRFDIYFNSHKEALRFGKQKKQVTIITK